MALLDVVGWKAARTVVVDGVTYNPGDSVPAAGLSAERKRGVLMSNRYVVPLQDPWARRTDWYGMRSNGTTGPDGDNPRRTPTPTYLDARSMVGIGGVSMLPFDESFDLPFAGGTNG